jgi:hypothetical protein
MRCLSALRKNSHASAGNRLHRYQLSLQLADESGWLDINEIAIKDRADCDLMLDHRGDVQR